MKAGDISRLETLVIVLLLMFVIASVILLSIGIPKAADTTCQQTQDAGIIMTVIGSILAALSVALTTLALLYGRVIGESFRQ